MRTKHVGQKTLFLALMLSLLLVNGFAGDKKEINKTFKAKGTVEMEMVSGDCTVITGKSGEIKITVVHDYDDDEFEAIFKEQGDTLLLKEDFKKSTHRWGSKRFGSKWTVVVPANTSLDFESASGDLDVSGLQKDLEARTASGDIKLANVKGDLKLKTASGDIKIRDGEGDFSAKTASGDIKFDNAKGSFEAKTASGDMDAKNVVFTGDSQFGSASGEINVEVAESPVFNLELATVSGDVVLDYNGNAIKGHFEFKGKVKNMSSPIPFDNAGEDHRWSPFGTRYFSKGNSPTIRLKSVSGDLELKK